MIEDNVWLGDNVSILPGVHVGKGCIVGTNSVVTKNVPPYCVVGGIPAKVLKNMK
ncbi:bacterial transferase hexapeptide family protein [Parabacteroides distasonis str. 3776 Po2 i]|nr:bacterial transferase hexapeptide family protein [Parabacteroides distasonis str. 3776 Po2 i]